MKERFNIRDVKPIFPTPANTVSLEHTNLAPEPYGIGMYMKQMSDLSYFE